MKQKQWLWGIAVLILVSFACNYPGASTSPTPTEDLITGVARTVSAQMTQAAAAQLTLQPSAAASTAVLSTLPATVTLAPLPTIAPPATAIPTPCNWAQFVSETIPDDSPVPVGTGFVKSWRLKNIGTCTWTAAYQLIFVNGDAMGAAAAAAMTPISIPPGGSVDVSVALTAPSTPGAYQGNFKLRAPDGTIFGLGGAASSSFWVKINSQGATVTPGPSATTSPTPTATGGPLPDLVITAITFNPASPTHGVPAHVSISVYNAGSAATTGPFTVKWWGLETYANPSCSWVVNEILVVHGGKVVECDYNYPSSYAPNLYSKAQVDTDNNITESNEGNNELKVPVTVQ